MHQMIKSKGLRRFLIEEAPSGVAALVIAELFYKFHSFVLECVAFLATWYVLSFLLDLATRSFSRGDRGVESKGPMG
jgi:hypothetical protein